MAGGSNLKRSGSNCRAALLCHESTSTGGASLQREMEALRVSKRLVRTVTQKLKTKKRRRKKKTLADFMTPPSGGECRIGAREEFSGDGRRTSSVYTIEDCIPRRALLVAEKAGVECFSYRASGRSRKKNPIKPEVVERYPPTGISTGISLPDDVLEMILVRLPLASLNSARCVCNKWRHMTTTTHFLRTRSERPHHNPWLFLFGATRDGCRDGEAHVLDVSLENWHRIRHDELKGKSCVSVANMGADIYIVGGNSSPPLERNSLKALKGVVVFNPLTRLWRKVAPMNSVRSAPILGVLEVSSSCRIFHSQRVRQEKNPMKYRFGGVSDVYEDPHRFSLRRRLRDAYDQNQGSPESRKTPSSSIELKKSSHSRFVLIAVGGHASSHEVLDSGEVYDPMTNRWTEIERLPGAFGPVCSGAVCGGMFYVYSELGFLARYDLERGLWVQIQIHGPHQVIDRFNPRLVSCRSRLFLFRVSWQEGDGVINRTAHAVRNLWELDLALLACNEVSRHPDAPMDEYPAFAADGDTIYGVEMFRLFGKALDFVTACHVSDTELRWSHVSRKHAANEEDVSTFTTKSMVVLRL